MTKQYYTSEELAEKIIRISALLENPETMSEDDRKDILEFFNGGLFYASIDLNITNPEIVERMISIFQSLETGAIDKEIVDAAPRTKTRLLGALLRTLKSGENHTNENYIALAKVYTENMFLVDPGAVDHLMEIMTPSDYKDSDMYDYLLQSFDEVKQRAISTKYYEEYFYKYLDFHIVNDEEFDFQNDEFAKRMDPRFIETAKGEYENKKELYELIQSNPDKLSAEELLKITNGIGNLITYANYSALDKKLLIDFIEKGYITNSKLLLSVEGAKSVDKIFGYLINNRTVRDNIYKDSRLKKLYDADEFFGDFKSTLRDELLDNKNKIADVDYVELAKIYVSNVDKPSLRVIGNARDKMQPQDFLSSELYARAAERFERKSNTPNDPNKWQNDDYLTFAFEYVEYLQKNGQEVDYENDPVLVYSDVINPGALRVQQIMLSRGSIKPTNQDIYYINSYIGTLLNDVYNRNSYRLSDIEKKYISIYMKRFFNYSIRNIEDHPEVISVVKYLSKIRSNTTLQGKNDEKNFFTGVIPDDFTRKIAARIQFDSDNSQMSNDELELILTLVASDNIYDTETFMQGIDNLRDRHVDVERSVAMKKYVECFADQYARQNLKYITEDDEPVFEIIYDYVDAISKNRDAFNIFEEQGISDILQLANKHKIPQEQADTIYGILEYNLKVSRYNVVRDKQFANRFMGKYEEKPCSSEEEFDRYLEQLQRIKLVERRGLSLSACQTIIKQTLLDGSAIRKNPEKYKHVVERAIEDLSARLEKKCLDTTYFIRSELDTEDTQGEEIDGRIRLLRKGVTDLVKRKDVSCLETLFHENTHQEQDYDMRQGKFGEYVRYIAEKEDIIRAYNEKYYVDNYKYMYCEIEAREKGVSKLVGFLQSLGINLEDSFVFHSLVTKDIVGVLNERADKEKENYEVGENKLISDNDFSGREKVTTYFDSLVRNNPVILRQHPALRIEYNRDGTLKSFADFVTDMEQYKDESDKLALYRKIVGKGNIIRPESIAETLDYMSSYTPPSAKAGVIMMLMISENVARVLNDTVSKSDEIPTPELEKLKKVLDNISNPDILEKNPILKKGLEKTGTASDKTGLEAIKETSDIIDIILTVRDNKPVDTKKYPKTMRHFITELVRGKSPKMELMAFKEASMVTPTKEKMQAMERMIEREEATLEADRAEVVPDKSPELGDESYEQ